MPQDVLNKHINKYKNIFEVVKTNSKNLFEIINSYIQGNNNPISSEKENNVPKSPMNCRECGNPMIKEIKNNLLTLQYNLLVVPSRSFRP